MLKAINNTVCSLLLAILLTASSVLAIQQETRVYQLGVLSTGGPDSPVIKGLLDGLKEAGFIRGETLHMHIATKTTAVELRKPVENFVAKNMDAIVTVGVAETAIAKRATREIPIIFAPATNPLEAGFVKSLARPETNLTGLAYSRDLEVRQKELEVFREVVPSLRRIVVLYDASEANPIHPSLISVIRDIANSSGLETAETPIQSVDQINPTLFAAFAGPTAGIFTICTNIFSGDWRTPKISRDRKLPLYGCPTQATKLGALVSYAPDVYQIGRRAAWYVDQILNGAKPQTLPVETPKNFELIINLKTSNMIGLIIPPEVLQRADKIIK